MFYFVELSSLLNFSKVVIFSTSCSTSSSTWVSWVRVSSCVRWVGLWSRGWKAGLWLSWPPSWCEGRCERLSTTIWNTDNNLIDKNLARQQQCFDVTVFWSEVDKHTDSISVWHLTILSILQGDVQLFTSPLFAFPRPLPDLCSEMLSGPMSDQYCHGLANQIGLYV